MSNNLIQPSMSSGELSPHLHARVDLERYQTGMAWMRNFFVDYRGGGTYRAGTRLVGVAADSTRKVRVIKFAFNTDQNYVLEFGHHVIRFIRDGEYILAAGGGKAITNVTQAVQATVTSAAHGFANGDQVFVTSVLGMTQLNQQTFIVSDVLVNSYKIKYLNGSYVDSTAFTAYSSAGAATKLYEVATTYDEADLFRLKYAQSADILTITHPSYQQRELKRLGENNWTLSTVSFAATITAPTPAPVLTKSSEGKAKYSYRVTTVNAKGEESVASSPGGIGNAVNIAATAGSIKIDWTAVAGADFYRVYKANPVTGLTISIDVSGQYGFIGETTSTSFIDPNIMPDFTRTPPKQKDPFTGSNWPAAVSYYQQRIVYGGSDANPETLYFSQTGQFKNFDESVPVKDDDGIEATVASLEINRIKYMVAMPGGLLILTSGSTFQVNGGGATAAITPGSISVIPQTYNGCGDISPIAIDFNVVYLQSQNSLIRSLTYNFYTGSYTPQDVSLFSQHLLQNYSIVDWAWAEEPDRIIWGARSDGRFISLTYVPDQKISGMALHSTEGLVESTCAIQEDFHNVLYMVVKRKINGTWYRFIERMMERRYDYGVEDAWNLDCALERGLTYPVATLTPAAKTGTAVICTASAAVLSAGMVGRVLRIGGGIADVVQFDSTTQIRVTFTRDIQDTIPETDVPLAADSGNWSITSKVTTVSGLWHLNGHTVTALADGEPVFDLVVTNGAVTLPTAASKIVVGLSYRGWLRTLPIDTGSLPTIQGKRKNIIALTARVSDTRGLKAGSSQTTLRPFRLGAGGDDHELITGDTRIVMDANWQVLGEYYISQENPLPASVLGLIPEPIVGDTGK